MAGRNVLERGRPMRFVWESVVLATLGVVDLVVTLLLIRTGRFGEANPILAYYLGLGLLAFAAVKLLLTFGPVVCLEVLRQRKPVPVRRMIRWAVGLYVALYVLVVGGVNLSGF